MNQPILKAEGLSYRYADAPDYAIRDINLEIMPGEYIAIFGPCGAGKTTLCLSMNGIVPHMTSGEMEGTILVHGLDTCDYQVRDLSKSVGMVFDNPEYQLSQLTVQEEIALGLENTAVPRDDMLRRIAEVLEIVELKGFEHRSPMALSGGQQQRLAIASALAMYPDMLVLDEPTSNLDPIGKQEVFSILRKLNRERGMTVVIVEHEVEAIAAYADRILVMDQGRIYLQGSPQEVFAQVDALAQMGMDVPQVSEMAYRLDHMGLWSQPYPVLLDEAHATLTARLGG